MLVTGTGTGVGKTWVAARLLTLLRHGGAAVAARKPVQSFDPGDPAESTDAAVLGASSGEPPEIVCPAARWYERAMAPPMAAEVLGRPPFTVADLARETSWPSPWPPGSPRVGLLEGIGGVRSPLADDGDTTDLGRLVAADVVLLVAHAGLGTINAVRASAAVLAAAGLPPPVVVLNRFQSGDDLHRRNLRWLSERDGMDVVAVPGGELDLVRRLCR